MNITNAELRSGHPEEEAVGGPERHPEETLVRADPELHHPSGEPITEQHAARSLCQFSQSQSRKMNPCVLSDRSATWPA